ncbi:MAG: protein-L-isoaspartate O-methyltransferase [Roseicyclus sp.]|jgi:protein-L-isoaspartate(D-aspartate) O-methyltransferase|uniref:protein-L-isoaspartate O-methyltransferase family protein n=1 Tax=Roseicyclus amphidinii TaxID=3034232 RepID=UPI0024E0DB1A|nr:protein-L-isoaspartate O-methyltransferase [Roseicyclus sp. Amp-Y-6]MCT4682187.1 protein-L-isoaspartate O-methyltransferase [Roseicyclus sp.]
MADFAARRRIMVDTQIRPSDVTSFPIIDAMLNTPREAYVPDAARDLAYLGGPIALGGGRQLMEPRSIGKMLEALDVTPGEMVLEIGPGLGYTTALLARMAEAVVAVEEDEALAREAEANLSAQSVDNAAVLTGPLADGSAKNAPYDAIVIFAGVEEIPAALTDQLRDGGRIMAVFMNGPLGEVRTGLKLHGDVSWRMEFNATAPVLPGFARAPSFEF